MSTCNQFLAPNGEPSLLYAGLLQKYGEDRATQVWNWVYSPAFSGGSELDVNGEPSLSAVEDRLNAGLDNSSTATDTVPKERFKANSIVEFNKIVEDLYKEARANPGQRYNIPLSPADVFQMGKERLTGVQLANLLDKEDTPSNIIFEKSMYAQMQNIPRNFAKGIAIEDSNPLQLDEASVQKQMNLMFAQIRNAADEPSGKWFDLGIQNEVLDAIIFQFYNIYSQLQNDPAKTEKLAGRSMMKYMREEVLDKFKGLQQAWVTVNEGKSAKRKPSAQSAAMVENLSNIINSFYAKGSTNSLWNFAIERLNSYGIKMRTGEVIDSLAQTESAVIEDENGELQIEKGAITKDRGDSSFEMDMKDTASTRLKLWLLATPESKFIDEASPENVTPDIDLFIGKEETRNLLQKGIKTDLILPATSAAKLKLTPLSSISDKVVTTERDRMSQKVVEIDGKPLRITAVRTVTESDTNDPSLTSRIEKEEGRKPEIGDVILKVEPYVQGRNILAPEMNFLGINKLASFESLFQDLSALLANREPSMENYLNVMKSSGNANIQRVAQRLDTEIATGKDHIAKEFVSVMSASYQRMLIVMLTRSKDGYIEPTVIDSNRASEVQTLQKFWQEAQKISEILGKNEAGQVVVDANLANGLWDELQRIYTEVPKRTILAADNEARQRLGKDFDRAIAEDQQKFAEADKAYLLRKKEFLRTILEVNGITLDDRAITDLMPDKEVNSAILRLGKGTQLKSIFAGFTQEGKPIGLVDVFVWRMAKSAAEDEGELEVGEEFEPYKANNPLYVENTAMRILAKVQLKYTPQIYSQTHKSAEGKTIYSYGLNSALSHAIRKFKEDPAYRAQYQDSYFAKNSWLLEQLNTQDWILDKFQLTYLDGIKNRYGSRDGVTRPDMSDREQWMTVLALFQNGGNEKSLAHMVSLTHSDKTKTPVYMNSPRLINTMTRKDGQLFIATDVLDKVYRSIFLSEHQRMIQPGGEEIKGYEKGKKHFFLLPMFNKEQMFSAEKDGTITTGERRAIWAGDDIAGAVINNQDNVLFESTAKKLISRQLNQMIKDTQASWGSSKLLEGGLPGSKNYYNRLMSKVGITASRTNWFDGTEKLDKEVADKIAIQLAAADYTINSFLFNTGLSQLFYGDPALTFKKDVPSTLIEYGKRLAKDVAPGRDGEWSHSKDYVTMTADDYEPLVKELSQLPAYATGKANATDAQEITTMKEHLSVMYAYGRVTKSQYTAALGIISKANGGYYRFGPELEAIILQPMKPVATGMTAPVNGVMSYDYVKSSSFPLYSPMTAGLEIDKLRKAMEGKNGIDRLNFISAKKIGAPVNILKLYDTSGKIDESIFTSAVWDTDARQLMNRSQFRIQQDNPYDEDKNAILTVSQMNKNITEKIPTIKSKFNYRGNEVSGKELRQIKEDIRKQLITKGHEKFLAKVGAEYDTEKDIVRFKDKKKFYNLLAEEAKSRDGYTVNDLLTLSSFVDNSDELVVPLAFTPSASRFEGLMMSMVKKIVQIKMPGHSFIQASPAGFRTLSTWEDTNLDRSQIIWTKPFDGDLKTAHLGNDGQVIPAQVVVGFNYFNNEGNRLNIQDFIIEDNGKKILDTYRLPAELFQLIGARIPNQGHSSMLPIEIVGFLPQQMGDMIVVPAGITKQMGADFDVDKLYTYHRAYTQVDGKLQVTDGAEDGLKNQYFDVHWSVLTNPEMLPIVMSPLDKDDLKDLAAELSPAGKQIPYYFSPTYQMRDFQSMKGAKVLVGQTSLALTSNAVLQTGNVGLAEWAVEDAKNKFMKTASVSVAREDGSELQLSEISGFGETTYKGDLRTKADNIQIQQSESVDHAKNRIIDKINLDPNTSAASLAMSRLQTPDQGTPGEDDFIPGEAINLEYNALLLIQPIVQEFSAALSTANDTLSTNFESKVKDKVYDALELKYLEMLAIEGEMGSEGNPRDAEPFLDFYESLYFNPQELRNNLKAQGKDYPARQIMALRLFKQFDEIGSQLVTMQSTMAQDTRGAGKDLLGALNTAEKKENPNLTSAVFLANTDGLFQNSEGRTTEVGVTYNTTIDTAIDLYSPELPYKALQKTYNTVMEQAGKEGITDEQKKLVFNAMKSFAFNSKSLGLYTNAYSERIHLLFTADGTDSLAKRVQKAKSSWGKNDYFLQRLQTNIDPDGIKPDIIEYNAAKASLADDVENSKAWLAMLTSVDEDRKNLGFDLLRYTYVTGGLQGARNFVKFIPWAAIEGSEISFGLREQFNNIEAFNNSGVLVEQIFQHNPSIARQLSTDLKELGNPESLGDTFLLPVFNVDNRKINPASDLAVKMTGADGKVREDYPTYLSFRKDNKWLLFKQMGSLPSDNRPLYARIDILGDSRIGLLEYSSTAGEIGQSGLRSVIAENRAPWFDVMEADPYKLSNGKLDALRLPAAQTTAMQRIGLNSETGGLQDILNSLATINSDEEQSQHIRTIAGILSQLERNQGEEVAYHDILGLKNDFTYEIGELKSGEAARFSSNLNKMIFSKTEIVNKHLLAENIIHEHLHYHTAILAMGIEGKTGWDRRGFNSAAQEQMQKVADFIVANPNLESKLSAVEDMRKQALSELQKRVASWNKEQYSRLEYAFSTPTEFISHVLSDKRTIGFMNTVAYDGKKVTLLDRVREIFSQIWNALVTALGVKNGTLAEESVKRVLDLLHHQQTYNYNNKSENFNDLASDLSNAKIITPELTAIDKVIGKLEEQKQELISSYTGILDRKSRLGKRHKIEEIDLDIAKLKESQDLMLVSEIGKKHLQWIAQVEAKEHPNDNEIMTAIRIGNMWRGIVDLMFGDSTTSVDPELAKLASQSGNLVHSLLTKGKEYMIDESAGVIPSISEFENVEDIPADQKFLRSLSSATKSTVLSHVSTFIETTSRQRDEDCYRLMGELNKLEKEMLDFAGGKRELELLYKKMGEADDAGMGLTLRYSPQWFDWRKQIVARRNGKLAGIEEVHKGSIAGLGTKKAVWNKFWNELDKKAVFVDTREFFDPVTGDMKASSAAKGALIKEVGTENVEAIIARAQERYLQYIEDKTTYFEVLDEEVTLGSRTAEEAETLKKEWQNSNSPNVFFDRANNARTYNTATERYITMAPKAASKEFWSEHYSNLMSNETTADFYNRYKGILDELLAYLPKSVQDRVGSDFLPVVRKEAMSDMFNVRDWVKTFNERFVKSIAADGWAENMNDRAYSKIPIDYVNVNKTAVEDRSKDLIGIARIFGMMALHYKHFSAAKDYIDMGETILKEIERSRIEGVSQMEQNGKVVTVKKGLRNALDALQYLKEYAVYRKPKQLELKGATVYAQQTGTGKKFSINPLRHRAISKEITRLLEERKGIEGRYHSGELDEKEYNTLIAPINENLGKYEGFSIYGSKIGDKLIGINQLKALSYNPFSAVANVTFGLISVQIHAAGGRDFTASEVGAAKKLMRKALYDKVLAEKILNTMDRLGVIGDYVDGSYGKNPEFRDNKPTWKKVIDPFAMMRKSDFYMKGITTLAHLLHQQVDVNSGKISVWDSLNNEGKWNAAEYGENTKWYSADVTEQTEWDKLRNRVIRINVILHGNQDKNAPRLINKFILGRLLGQFRSSWLPEGWYSRFQNERFDEQLGRAVKGRYRSFFNLDNQVGAVGYAMIMGRQLLNIMPWVKMDPFSGITTIGGKLLSDGTDVDMENVRRTFSELGFFLTLATVVAMLKRLQDDDDKNPYIQVVINMLIRTKQDIDLYASTSLFDAVFRDPIPAVNVIKDYWKAVGATQRLLMDDDYEFEQWVLKMTKAGIPIPQTTLINKSLYMVKKDLDALQ